MNNIKISALVSWAIALQKSGRIDPHHFNNIMTIINGIYEDTFNESDIQKIIESIYYRLSEREDNDVVKESFRILVIKTSCR